MKDVLQLLKEQSVKMEKLDRALSVIQQGMLKNNPGHVKDSVSERDAQHPQVPTRKRGGNPEKAGIHVSERYPEKLTKGRRGLPLLPPRSESQRKGRAAHRSLTPRPPESRPHKRMGNGSWWKKMRKIIRKIKRRKIKRRMRQKFLCPLRRNLRRKKGVTSLPDRQVWRRYQGVGEGQ